MSYNDDTRRITNLHDTIKELRTEIERLRAALQVLADGIEPAARVVEREMTRQMAWEYVRDLQDKVRGLEKRIMELEKVLRGMGNGGR